jgi:hypothetical protein
LPDEEKKEQPESPKEESIDNKPVITGVLKSFFSYIREKTGNIYIQIAILFICLWIIYNSSSRLIGGSDCYSGRFLPVNLVLYGTYHYDNLHFLRGETGQEGMPGGMLLKNSGTPSDGHVITFYPTLIPTLLVPFYYIPFKILKISPESYLPFYMDKWFMGAFVAGAAVFLFLSLAKVKVGFWGGFLLTISFALGTSNWAISSQAFWQHGPSSFFLVFSLFMVLKLEESNKWIGPLGLVTGLAAGARPTNSVWFMLVALYVFIYLLRTNKKLWWKIIWYFVWASPVVIFLFVYNWVYFGSPLTSGYNFNPVNMYIPDYLHIHNFPAGFRGLLFSTSLGLLPNAPFFLFIFPAFLLGQKKFNLPALGLRRILWIFIIFHIALYSCYREWWAGFSYAYRYLTDIMPFLCFLLFPILKWKPFKWGGIAIYIVFLVWSMSIQFYGAFYWAGSFWFGRHWNDITYQHLVKWENLKRGIIFEKPSVHWSLDMEKHNVGMELKYFRFSKKCFLTPSGMKRDLTGGREVTYGKYAPIVLTFGTRK